MTERVLQKEDRISVAELTERMMKEYDMKREEAAREIYKMWQVGKIELTDNSPPKSIFSYFSSVYAMVLGSSSSISDNFAIHICHTPICSFHLHSLCVGSSLRALFARICAHRGSLFKSRRTGPA